MPFASAPFTALFKLSKSFDSPLVITIKIFFEILLDPLDCVKTCSLWKEIDPLNECSIKSTNELKPQSLLHQAVTLDPMVDHYCYYRKDDDGLTQHA